MRRTLIAFATVVGAFAPVVASAQTLDFDPAPPAIGDFAPVTLNGTDQITSLTIEPFTVVDSTESGGEKIVTASTGNGAGTYFVAAALVKLRVPASAQAGTYSAAASIAVLSGP